MSISFIMGGHVAPDIGVVDEFCARYPLIRQAFDDASAWTGVSAAELRAGAVHDVQQRGMQDTVGKLSQAALVIGMHDELASHGIRPHAVGGLSLGSRIGACLSGSVNRPELFAMLHHERLVPPPDGPAQGLAALTLSGADDPADYYGTNRRGIHLACNHGRTRGGERRRILVGGYLDALETFGKSLPPSTFRMLDLYEGAYHTPLAGHFTDFMAPYITDMTFRDPAITLCVPNESGPLTCADEVRTSYIEHGVTAVRMELLLEQLVRIGTRAVIALGPGLVDELSVDPMKLTRVTAPDDLRAVIDTLHAAINTSTP
ncbi:hypothetical protein [Nocardia fluminea]|uniref:hypothetical protein n=1 Tax=Nocardia fluminea TaxID=134984 RepID=UPI003D14C448